MQSVTVGKSIVLSVLLFAGRGLASAQHTERMSVDAAGVEGNGGSGSGVVISRDGRFVAFGSYASNLVAGDVHADFDVFVRDRLAGTIECISVDPAGAMVDGLSILPALSADGRFVAFESVSSALVPSDTNQRSDVFVRDRWNGVTERVSVDSSGLQGDRDSTSGSISADGRSVVFISSADNLVADDRNGVADVFVRDRTLGTTVRVSVATSGAEANDEARPPYASPAAISGDGRDVVFDSNATNLVAGDLNGVTDVFVHGPWLTLEADPPVVTAGATITFTTWTGDASNLAMLVLMDIDDVPMFVPAFLSTFDRNGVWSLPVPVPAGITPCVMTFQSYGFVPTGKVRASNEVPVTFQ